MFTVDVEGRQMGVKPMNCPGHAHLFASRRHSYRDLPVRYFEPGLLHRNEPSGVLHGLLRVRHFAQDDAHIFCTEEQVQAEVRGCLEMAFATYALFDLERAPRALHASRAARRHRRDVGPRRGEADAHARRARPVLRAEPRRRRVLRAEDRHAHDRLAGALVAAGDGAARLLDARSLRAAATPAPTTRSTRR